MEDVIILFIPRFCDALRCFIISITYLDNAPYFANELVNHLVSDMAIEPLVDVKRFSKILQRII